MLISSHKPDHQFGNLQLLAIDLQSAFVLSHDLASACQSNSICMKNGKESQNIN